MPHDRCVFVLILLSGFDSAHPHPIRNLLLATQVHSDRFQSVADWVRSVCVCVYTWVFPYQRPADLCNPLPKLSSCLVLTCSPASFIRHW